MKNKLFKFLYVIFFISVPLHGATGLKVDPKLAHCFNVIQSFEEGKNLVSSILAKGPLGIVAANNSVVREFCACWDKESRTILICLQSHPSIGELIGSLLFELHNASVSESFEQLDQMALRGKISRQGYIQSMEYLEYINSINAAKMAKIGIQKKIFPKNALLPTYQSFEEHFYYQKISGHSEIIGKNFDTKLN